MKKIFKFEIKPDSIMNDVMECFYDAPDGAWPLSVGEQKGKVVLWAEVDVAAPVKRHRVFSVGTGHGRVPESCRFIGTIQHQGFVWHIYA